MTQTDPAARAASEPAAWFDGAVRVMFVHAHPDDETITTGGTLAALSEAGREPLLVTLSRGEQGEVVAGPLQALAGTHGLAVVRQNELKTALDMLGLARHAFLGVEPARAEGLPPTIYEDSGMAWGADGRATAAAEAGAEALTSVPAVEALNDLLAAANLSGAEAIVSYDDGGGYGHPDHVLAHRLSRAVAHALGLPFWEIVSDAAAVRAAVQISGIPVTASDAGAEGIDDAAGTDGLGGTDAEGDPEPTIEAHDIAPWLDRKLAALRAHGTQLTVDGTDIVHVGGQREAIGQLEGFRRIHG